MKRAFHQKRKKQRRKRNENTPIREMRDRLIKEGGWENTKILKGKPHSTLH